MVQASRPDVRVGQSSDQEDHTRHVLLVLPIFGILSLPGVCSVVSKLLLGLRGVEDLSFIHFGNFCMMQKFDTVISRQNVEKDKGKV